MVQQTPSKHTRVEFWVRATVPRRGVYERVVKTLEQLETAGNVDEFAVREWGKSAPVATDPERRDGIVARVDQFRDWAHRTDETAAFGDHHDTGYGRAGRGHTELLLPEMALAEFQNGQVVNLVTSDDDGDAITGRLDTIERDDSDRIALV